jgi:hypothetical protein
MYIFLLFKTPFDLLYLLFLLGIFLYFIPQISPQIKNKCLEAGICYIWRQIGLLHEFYSLQKGGKLYICVAEMMGRLTFVQGLGVSDLMYLQLV